MNTSILIVGTYEFLNALPQIHEQAIFDLEIVTSVEEARSHLRRSLPDILLVQASIHNSEKFCQWSKEQSALQSPYCILLEDRLQENRHSCTWNVEQTAAILEDVADAYVDFCWLNDEKLKATNRLILAHIQVGRRDHQKYQELIDKNHTLSALAITDPLTQLSNRRAMERDLITQILASRSNNKPLSLLMIDVDCFKKINDTYGHLVGDRVLQLLSSRLKHNLRSQDLLFRYGGEEFVIILNNTDCQQGLFIAERLRRIVGEQIITLDSLSLTVTVSIGAACLQSLDDRGGITLLTRADNCLLNAKARGRNCVIGGTEQLCETKQLAIM